jgi:hypothetical protein
LLEDVASVFSLDDGVGSSSETSANSRIAPQKTVLVVSSKFLKSWFCIKNAGIINCRCEGRVRALTLFCCCTMRVPVLVLPSGREAAKFELRIAHGAAAYKFLPLELAPPGVRCCNYRQQIITSKHRSVQNTSLEPVLSQTNSFHAISCTF